MNRKIIVYLGNFGRPEENAAGKRVYGIALALSRLGYQVVLIGKSRSKSTIYPIPYGLGISFYSFPDYQLWCTKKYLQYVSYILRIVGSPDILITYGSPGLAWFNRKIASFCKKQKIKLIADVVDWLPADGNVLFNLIKSFDTYWKNGILNCKCNGIIAISSYLSDFYIAHGCRTITIPPLVEEYHKNLGDNSVLRVVYAGVPFRLGKVVKKKKTVKDRLDLAIRGIAGVAGKGIPVIFDIFGISKEQYLTAYPCDSNLVNQNDKVLFFHGKVSMESAQSAVSNADFTILLRDTTKAAMAGFPTKVVESLSLGTPVITTITSDLSYYIKPGKNGFFVDISSEENLIADLGVIFTCGNDSVRAMKQYCFESRQFCIENYVDSLDSFLTSL